MSVFLVNGTIFTGDGTKKEGNIGINDLGKIDYIGPDEKDVTKQYSKIIDISGQYLAPGLIDVHVHGGIGSRFVYTETISEELDNYSNWIASRGVTGFLCSVLAPSHSELLGLIKRFVQVFETKKDASEFLGLHLEGPFINPEKHGAIIPPCIRRLDLKLAQEIIEAGKGWIKQITIAPEMDGAAEVAAYFKKNGVVPAFGHTDATYAEACQAIQGDFTHITHMFNVMRGFHHREPGLVGAVLNSKNVTAELIADGFHVHPGAIELLLSQLGTERIVLITDAMEAAGLPDGEYLLSGQKRIVKNGKATLENGTIAGSTVTLNQCVQFIHKNFDLPWEMIVRMASYNPANVMGYGERLGSIEIGKDASLILVDENFEIMKTFVRGKVIYSK